MYKSEKELKEEALHIITEAIRAGEMRQGCTNYTYYAEIVLKQLEPIIHAYAPLPESIQWALNLGDGVYRP